MKDNNGTDFLKILVGEKLSSVTFVMDYLQLDFDGNSFNLHVWPSVTVGNMVYKFGEPSYRDQLCSLITQVVKEARGQESQNLTIMFNTGDSFSVSLDPNNPELASPEIAIFTYRDNNWYVFN